MTISQVDSRLDSAAALVVEELIDKLQAGDADVEAFIKARPEYAERLRRLLPALRVMADLSNSLEDGQRCVEGDAAELGTLGDFHIVREIGRGGMGVVYEAEQISLRRRVALKALPLAATMDPRHLQRFHNEARAAACLHHGHIVPVFYVGCERGVHFYAMQLIEGQTLAAVIRELRRDQVEPEALATGLRRDQNEPEALATGRGRARAAIVEPPAEGEPLTVPHVHGPAATAETLAKASLSTEGPRRGKEYYRKVAELGVQAAEALDYAHERGVIHRDVKPGNLMLDGHGALWVTDFGLAHLQHADGSLTMTGDLVGTLRYMSPEQAMGKRVVVDHRCDVYSLGVTLYELLTLRPAFTGNDRQELLRQIAFEEPPAPRKIERDIPSELETIALKAMEKNPADRYGTAQDLADDLQRFLQDQPIRARRASLRQVAAKWVRRHRPVVWATAALFLVLAVVGGANGLWWVQKRSAAQVEARAELREASRLQQEEKWPEALGAVRRARLALAGVWADRGLRQEIEDLGKDLEMARLLQEARLRGAAVKDEGFDIKATIQAYAEAFEWYGLDVDHLEAQEAAQRIRTCSIAVHLVAALDDWASLWRMREAPGWQHRVAVCRAADPDLWRNRLRDALESKDPEALEHLADSARGVELPPATAVLLARLAHGPAADERVVMILRQAQQRHYDDFWVNFELGSRLSELAPPQMEEAIRYLSVAAVLRPQSAFAHTNLGVALRGKGKVDEAIACFQRAIAIDSKLANAHNNLGTALADKGQRDEAIVCYRKAIALDPKIAMFHFNLGSALRGKGNLDEAIVCYRKAIALDLKIALAHHNLGEILYADKRDYEPAIASFNRAIAIDPKIGSAHYYLGNALMGKGKVDEAIELYRRAIAIDPKNASAHSNLGNALKGKGKVDEAIECYRRAIAIDSKLANAHNGLGVALWVKGKEDEAIKCCRRAIALDPKDASAHNNLGVALWAKGKEDEAITCYRRAIALDPKYALAHGALGQALIEKGEFIEAQKALRQCLALLPPSHPQRGPASQLLHQCQQQLDAEAKLKAFLAGKGAPTDPPALAQMANLAQQPYKRLYLAATRLYRDAFARQPPLADAHRYNAAVAAALASCGQGKDAADLSEMERARLRGQALDWLRADLAACNRLLATDPQKTRPIIASKMRHWLQDSDFNGVRGSVALARLTEVERSAWQKLWADIADTLARAQGKATPTTNPRAK